MTEARKKGTRAARSCRGAPRATKPTASRGAAGYPSAFVVLATPDLAALVGRALRAAGIGGAVALGAWTTGCAEPPQCAPDRMGELTAHAGPALEEALRLEPGAAAEQLGLGIGLTTHPRPSPLAIPLGGVVAEPMPTRPPPTEEE